MAVMPVVTQEELRSIRLRPLSSSNEDYSPDLPYDVIAGEEPEGEVFHPQPPQGPRARPPPVAAKPPVPRWLPGHTAETPPAPRTPPVPQPPPATLLPEDQGHREVSNMKVWRSKPKRSHLPQNTTSNDDIMQQHPHWLPGHVIDSLPPSSQSENSSAEGTAGNRFPERALQKSKKLTPPPVPRKPDVILRPSSNIYLNNKGTDTGVCLEEEGGERNSVHQMRRLCLGEQRLSLGEQRLCLGEQRQCLGEQRLCLGEQDSPPPCTEDLFTIIHRSKKKLLSAKESVEVTGSRQAPGSPTRGGCDPCRPDQDQRSTSKTDSFMAFLQRRRSQKPSARERVSASELLKTSKPLSNHNSELSRP